MLTESIKGINTHGNPRVLTAKSSEELFNKVEKFQRDACLNSRNDAINVLIAIGLYKLGVAPEEFAKEYAAKYNYNFKPEEVVK